MLNEKREGKKGRKEDRNGFGVTFKRPPTFFEMPQKRKEKEKKKCLSGKKGIRI